MNEYEVVAVIRTKVEADVMWVAESRAIQLLQIMYGIDNVQVHQIKLIEDLNNEDK